MSKFKRIDVLLDGFTGKKYNIGDLVVVTTTDRHKREYRGKIKHVETLNIVLDMSKQYECNTKRIDFEDIYKIHKY